MGLRAGHRAFKIKIGRGHKWMDRDAGDARDLEVVETIRKHAGDKVHLGVDANNGYDLADGEGQDDVEAYRPFVDAKALDMPQGDMYTLGIEGILAEAAMAMRSTTESARFRTHPASGWLSTRAGLAV